MDTVLQGEWVVDLGAMTCFNINFKIIVAFENRENTLSGKLKYIPMSLFAQWAAEPLGLRRIQNTVKEAEGVFLRTYFKYSN